MAEGKKKGFMKRLLGVKPESSSGCCSMKVEEITEGEAADSEKDEPKPGGGAPWPAPERKGPGGCCCG
ncbi:MAG: hypothetical protein QUU85_17635 [Candidatus Eisenbacteria bacterium]|nr:hypothetical protein [Candidatus Eisenbacteria bacterium]